jgi:prepilin-type N-terminal cleavage/methylation domain-containing protein
MKVVSGQWSVVSEEPLVPLVPTLRVGTQSLRRSASMSEAAILSGHGRGASCQCVPTQSVGTRPISNPQSLIPNPSRSGLSLLEVLVSIVILSVGMVAVATLIPAGKLRIAETNKADRTGACGRAGLREVKVRRMLDPNNAWASAPSSAVFVIDPLGYTGALGSGNFGGTASTISRINLKTPITGVALTSAQAEAIFRWHDDLTYVQARDSTSPTNGERPMPVPNATAQQNDGNFSWFLTVAPQVVNGTATGVYGVSAVVCYKRALSTAGEASSAATVLSGQVGYGGVSISVAGQWPANWTLKDNDWILLCSRVTASGAIVQATWYRVVGAGYDESSTTTHISLAGPDWNGGDNATNTNYTFTAVSVNSVSGVYSTTAKLDNDGTWSK